MTPPPATSLAFFVKSSLISNIMVSGIRLNPAGAVSPCFLISNSTRTLFISFMMASNHSWSPFSLSISIASAVDRGMRMPNLYPDRLCHDCDILIRRFLFLRMWAAHQSNAGSSIMRLSKAYSAVSTGLVSFSSFRGSQEVDPSAHSTSRSQPAVVCFFFVVFPFVVRY